MEPKYTKLFSKFILENPTYLSSVIVLSSPTYSANLISAITAQWESYEICDTDFTTDGTGDLDFKQYFRDVFLKFKPYYEEMLANYTKSYDYATGNKKTTHTGGTNSATVSATDAETDIGFALPNKAGGAEYPSTKKTIDGESGSTSSGTSSGDVETTYTDEFIQLKNQYMNQIRDLFYEYASQFAVCFWHML